MIFGTFPTLHWPSTKYELTLSPQCIAPDQTPYSMSQIPNRPKLHYQTPQYPATF